MAKKRDGLGLRGYIAGKTALCTVGKPGVGLTYCGYGIDELAENARFEEVAYLLTKGNLPTQSELDHYLSRLQSLRELPQSLQKSLELIPAGTHPMDVMRTGCSVLGTLETERDFAEQDDHIDRMIALFPGIICYWYRYAHDGKRIETVTDEQSLGAHFLHLLHDKTPSELHEQVMNVSLILYAEHEFNASTFTARVCASSLSDIHSCITGAIGTLRGPLHGGANEAVMKMIGAFRDPDHAEQEILGMLERKEKVMGFGHPVYQKPDPRSPIIKKWSKRLAEEVGDTNLYEISERCEEVMLREKNLFCNADFFHASTYHYMGIPTDLYTPIFVMSRVTGWTAHIKEQRADNRLIRPSAEYIGSAPRNWVPMSERS